MDAIYDHHIARLLEIILIILLLLIFITAAPAFGQEQDTGETGFEGIWGISIQPQANWAGRMLGMDEVSDNPIKYHMTPNAFTTYEGEFWHKRSGWRLGVSAGMDDNVVGELYDFMISAGYRGFLLRMGTGQLAGHVEWSGVVTAQTPRRWSFKGAYTNIDVLWDWGLANPDQIEESAHGMYLGIGYTSLKLPVLVRWAENRWQVKGVDIYQPDTEVKAYSLVLGQENMSPAFLYRPPGPWWWLQYQVRIGYFNDAALRQNTLDLMKELNPGMPKASREIPLFFSEFEFTLGAQYVGSRGGVIYSAGAGYSLMGSMFTGESGGFGLRQASGDPALYTGFSLWRHGPVLRVLARW